MDRPEVFYINVGSRRLQSLA